MGSCGCGDDIEEFQFPGPAGSVYTIGRWVGCEQCHGTAIVLDRVEPDDQRWVSLVPPAPVAWHGGHVLPLIDVDKLRRLLVERVTFGPDDDEYATLDDALYDHLRDCVEAAMFGYGAEAPQSDSKPGADQEATGGGPGPETASGGRCGPSTGGS
jgi:hypothetical protein